MRPERDLLGPPCGGSAHGTAGVLFLPGGAVGLLPRVVVVVAVGVGTGVGADVVVVGAAVGTTVGGGPGVTGRCVAPGVLPEVGAVVGPVVGAVVGRVVGAEVGPPVGAVVPGLADGGGVDESSDGLLGSSEDSLSGVDEPSAGRGVWAAASTGGCVVRCLGLAGSGSGISGVSSCGPPRRLLAMRTR